MVRMKLIAATLIISFIAITAVLVIYLKVKNSTEVVSPMSGVQPTPTTVEELATWIDQSGFIFQYPKSLILNPHDEDKENYAHVELTSATHSGNIIVWAKDTTATDNSSWLKIAKVSSSIDTTLGGEAAKKVLNDQKSLISDVHNGYLYQIEANLTDAPFWQKVYDTVSSSFAFTENNAATNIDNSGTISSEESTSDEGEEVIE